MISSFNTAYNGGYHTHCKYTARIGFRGYESGIRHKSAIGGPPHTVRICILTQADTLAWTQHYVDAFRERAEVLTVGPGLTATDLENWGVDEFAETLVPNDIDVALTDDLDLRAVLPADWVPDLLVGISKGGVALRTLPDTLICPSVYLSIDTWQSPGDYVDAQCYDFTFAAQRTFVDRLRAAGAANVSWLPLACNPAAHFPTGIEPDLDIGFVGNIILPVHQQRHELLKRLQDSFSSVAVTRAFGDEVCNLMARGRIAFNHCAVFDVNMRIFEAMAMGRPVLTNRDAERNGLFDLFEDGKHMIVYDNEEDIVNEAAYYLNHPKEREAIARTGYENVLAHHTYLHRVDTILETVRDQVPALIDSESITGGRIDQDFANFVPYGARHVVDFGLNLHPFADELRARGTMEITGIASNTLSNEAYSRILRLDFPSDWPRNVDTVVLPDTTLLHHETKDAIRRARNMLTPGGTLIVRLSKHNFSTGLGISSFDQLESALSECGLHLNLGHVDESPGNAGVVVRARKRTRVLRRIFDEGFRDLPEMDRQDLSDWVTALGEFY